LAGTHKYNFTAVFYASSKNHDFITNIRLRTLVECGLIIGDFKLTSRPLGRPRRRRQDNIKMDLQEMRWGGMDWIALAEDTDRWRALVNAVMNIRVP
jgi:hypothetical protein